MSGNITEWAKLDSIIYFSKNNKFSCKTCFKSDEERDNTYSAKWKGKDGERLLFYWIVIIR